MRKDIIIAVIVVWVVHFGLTILAIFNGFIIFRGPSTPAEYFWEGMMDVLLFPSNMLLQGVAEQWAQTFAIAANSLLWASVCVGVFLWIRKSFVSHRRSNEE